MKIIFLFIIQQFQPFPTSQQRELYYQKLQQNPNIPDLELQKLKTLVNYLNTSKKRNNFKRFLVYSKNHTSEKKLKRKLKQLKLHKLSRNLGMCSGDMMKNMMIGLLFFAGAKFLQNKKEGGEIDILVQKYTEMSDNRMTLESQMSSDKLALKHSILDLGEKIKDMEQSLISNLENLNHWIDSSTLIQLQYMQNVQENQLIEYQMDITYTSQFQIEKGNNTVKTSKYLPLTFIPMNFFYQFSKLANIYFLILTTLQFIKPISITNGVPTILPALLFIIAVSMIKDFLEDRQRWKEDDKLNNEVTKKYKKNLFINSKYSDIYVGEIIKIHNDQFIPADLLLIETSDKKQECFLETKNLDGETNLNKKKVQGKLKKIINKDSILNLREKKIILKYDPPNAQIYKFNGTIQINEEVFPINNSNVLLRGCYLKNTDYVIGIVLYNGHQTKIMMNSIRSQEKKSLLEHKMNKYILFVFCFQMFFCFFASSFYLFWLKKTGEDSIYLNLGNENFLKVFFLRFGNWILIFGNFVPISLVVTVETVKYMQAQFLQKSPHLKDYRGIGCQVNSSNLNEELGQIQFIFSDKTGTLTQNKMIFKHLVIKEKIYPQRKQEVLKNDKLIKDVQNVDFEDNYFFNKVLEDKGIQDILILLSTCHTVQKYKGQYSASSPDELAFVNFSKKCGIQFLQKDENECLIVDNLGKQEKYQLLYEIEFTSKRKRMSVIVRKDDKIFLFTKGADNIMKKRAYIDDIKSFSVFQNNVDDLANQGLRILLLGKKEISQEDFIQFEQNYQLCLQNVQNQKQKLEDLYDSIENQFEIIGATAIEDQLQKNVPETIKFIREGGIKVWVLTGDKVETAKNIAYSTNLFEKKMVIIDIIQIQEIQLKQQFFKLKELIEDSNNKIGVVISGDSIQQIVSNKLLKSKFIPLTLKCESVLCCRVSPKQKRVIIDLVREVLPRVRTLAIGDGANDVNMIVGANVGVGIKGVEGTQASQVADYSIGEFRFLKNLLFEHGREYYRKNSIMVLYNFWKNIVLVLPQFFYALFYSNFSGVTLYDAFLYQFVNIFYTSLPIIIFCLYDQEKEREDFLSKPQYYLVGIRNIYFNLNIFLIWFLIGIMQAIFIALLISFLIFSPQKNGRFLGFWGYGILVFICTQIVSNIKIMIFSNSFNFWIYFFVFGGFGLFIISFIIISLDKNNFHFSLFQTIFGSPVNYIAIVLVIVICSFFDHLWELAQKMLFFNYTNLEMNLTKQKNEYVKLNDYEQIIQQENMFEQIQSNQTLPSDELVELQPTPRTYLDLQEEVPILKPDNDDSLQLPENFDNSITFKNKLNQQLNYLKFIDILLTYELVSCNSFNYQFSYSKRLSNYYQRELTVLQ